MLIGLDNIHLLMQRDQPGSRWLSGDLYATQTPFGWLVSDCEDMTSESCPLTIPDIYAISEHEFDTDPDDLDIALSRDDITAMDVVNHTIDCIDDYKFEMAVLFRHDEPKIPDNLAQVQPRFFR